MQMDATQLLAIMLCHVGSDAADVVTFLLDQCIVKEK